MADEIDITPPPPLVIDLVAGYGVPNGGGGGGGGTVTVNVGSTTTGAPGSNAQVTNTGTSQNVVLAFVIPEGQPGATGPQGPAGAAGAAATITVGTTTTGTPGSAASVSNSGTANAAVFNFTIPQGATGATGPQGPAGAAGAAATITVGTTTTGTPGSAASVSNSGTANAAVFNFTIPQGAQGPQGPAGAAGAAATIAVGTTTTGAAGSNASVSNSGTANAAVFNFTIPQGAQGPQGPAGAAGPNTVSNATTTTFNGLLAGNGSSVGVATIGTGLAFAAGQLAVAGVVLTTTAQTVAGVKTFADALDLEVQTLAEAATVAVDAAQSNKFHLTLTGNRTIANPTNPVDGRVIIFRIAQDGTGNRVVAWGSDYRFRGDLAAANVVLSTAGNTIDRIAFEYVATDARWDCISFIKGS